MGKCVGKFSNNITAKALEALNSADHGKRLSLGQSLYGTVRAGKDATISVYFDWRYRLDGKIKTMPVGTWPATSLKALRDRRDQLQTELRSGIDPAERQRLDRVTKQADLTEAHATQQTRIEALAAKQARITVRGLFDQWQRLALKSRVDQGSEARRAFERDVFPIIGDMAVVDVTKIQIQTIVDTMMARDVVRMTKRVLSDLRQMFGFAMDRDLVDADPTARIRKAKLGKDGERDRVMSEAELTLLFKKLPASFMAETSQCALLIQLATVTRIGEVLGATWRHVDLQRRIWTLPDTKNGKSHTVWLSDFALKQFQRLYGITGLTDYCFPATRLDGPVCSKTVTKQVADRQRGQQAPMSGRTQQTNALTLPGGQWRPHDLRRTGATVMAELGTLPDVVERCLNHTDENRMKRIYQRAQYEVPMRNAWQLLGQRLEKLGNPNRINSSAPAS